MLHFLKIVAVLYWVFAQFLSKISPFGCRIIRGFCSNSYRKFWILGGVFHSGKIHDHKLEFCTYFFLNPGDIKTLCGSGVDP